MLLEEIAALNLAKYRKVQTELGKTKRKSILRQKIQEIRFFSEESAERADVAENQLGKLRAKNRSTVSAGRTSPAVSEFYQIPSFFSIETLFVQRDLRESTVMRASSMVRSSSVRPR